ncbi:uncharacterized protein UHOD_04865 [Ustilago sp. UG-2017b]|nr:uncharacterized protein UHOD_12387 [Ustilago sp. UG-2017b]SPC65796.1 uncharacterized protein UHOD_04865 [Ustilago sp. UG-2017b]
MVKLEPILSLLLGVGVATTAYAATIPPSSASHRDTGAGTGAGDYATEIPAHFANREELSPFAKAQAESQMQDFFSRHGQCSTPSRTCHDYICLLDTPHCKPYSAEEQRETIEKTQKMLLDLISTVKCYPVPKGVDGCNDQGYCDVFKTKDFTDSKCRMLKQEEYADVLANHPDLAPHLGDDDEDEEEPRRRKLQRRSDDPASNPDKGEGEPVYETSVEALQQVGLGQIGTCDVESRTCAKDHVCKLGTPKCRPFDAGKRIKLTETFYALEMKVASTGKCVRTSHNKDWCNQYGFCELNQEMANVCRAIEFADDESEDDKIGMGLPGTAKIVSFLVLKDGKWIWPDEVQGTGAAEREEPTHMYQHKDGDVDFTQYRTQPQQPAVGRDDQVQNFSSYLVTITEQPDMLEALYQAANVHDQPSMVQIREQLILLSHNKKATRKLLKSKRAHATKAELFAHEPALYGRITKRSTDAGLQTVTFDPTSTDATPNPTSEEVCAFMEVADNIHSDLTMVYALASVLGIESIGDVRTFWEQLHTWAADEKEAFKALKRGKLAAMLEESKSIPGPSVSS